MNENYQIWRKPGKPKYFLESVRGGIPLASEQIDVMLRVVRAATPRIRRLLDLGCGDGILGRSVLAAYPQASGVLLDFSEPMIEAARQAAGADRERIDFFVEDFAEKTWRASVRDHGPFDLVLSGFAIHHESDQRKRELYREIYELLTPGGLFVNLEHVAPKSSWAEEAFGAWFMDSLWSLHRRQGGTKSRDVFTREHESRDDRDANVLAPLELQCRWLQEIGFVEVDCYFKVFELALFGGRKPEG